TNLYFNPNGTDGFLVEAAALGTPQAGINLYNFEPFDLRTGAVSGIPLTFTTNNSIFYPIVQDDVGLALSTLDFTTMLYDRAVPIPAGFGSFAFPAGSLPGSALVDSVATNSSSSRSAYLAIDTASGAILTTRGDVTTGSGFSPPVDVTGLLGPNLDFGALAQYYYDPNADRGYLLLEDASTACDQQSPQLVTVDYATGSAAVQTLAIGGGSPGLGSQGYHMAIDPATHVAAIATSCQLSVPSSAGAFRAELTLLDLASGKTSRVFQHLLREDQLLHGVVFAPGGDSATVGIDPVNHLVLQRSTFCPQLIGGADINARACLNLYDESGRLAKTIPGLFPDGFADMSTGFNGVNGTTRTGVANGQEQNAFFVYSVDVQPYAY
ncbi:MAG TPA: hypothetical protein VE826_14720, partial [Dongiaceae bacterium]|nr:hypothetical protein [Dongiaceae bacterium]